MDFLKEINIDNNTIESIKSNYSNTEVYELSTHRTNVTKIIEYFRQIGIEEKAISNLLINNIDLFLMDINDIEESFKVYDLNEIVSNINNDFVAINQYI